MSDLFLCLSLSNLRETHRLHQNSQIFTFYSHLHLWNITCLEYVLLFPLFFALIVATGVCICWGYFVYTIKFNKFQQRYAQISVQWYEGSSQMPKRFYSSYHFSTQLKEEPKDASDPTQKLLPADESDKIIAP
ncbi:hypothetical protein M3Y98_00556000 [Aphelenchoides besseyi]|nr:hypothetical protein M3Y98_00556000 [Aphelenchoides besseyi]KAI6194147.1 hypothetical protein M3Y96_01093800 [Aphelenchoides besseyi]